MKHLLKSRHRTLALILTAITVLLAANNGLTYAIPLSDLNSIQNGTPFYDPTANCDDIASLTPGSDNESQIWNYFAHKGLPTGQVAGIMGNLEQESQFDPEARQDGGNSTVQPLIKNVGWGVAQWTYPSQVVKDLLTQYRITTPGYELNTQLDLVWAQMNDVSPAGYQDLVKDLPSDPQLAAAFFNTHYESSADKSNARETFAVQILQKYDHSTIASCASQTPQCRVAAGDAKIICEAKKYDTTSYQASAVGGHEPAALWHRNCPVIGPSCYTDCSGLVNLAIYDAFGVDLAKDYGYTTQTERSDHAHWEPVSFSQLQPGDIMQPGDLHGDHVAIVDHVVGNKIYTFESYNDFPTTPQPDQVGPGWRWHEAADLYLHWIGPGS